jgi:hypothetical protein
MSKVDESMDRSREGGAPSDRGKLTSNLNISNGQQTRREVRDVHDDEFDSPLNSSEKDNCKSEVRKVPDDLSELDPTQNYVMSRTTAHGFGLK